MEVKINSFTKGQVMKLFLQVLCICMMAVYPYVVYSADISGASPFVEQNSRLLQKGKNMPSEDQFVDEYIEKIEKTGGVIPKDGFVPNAEVAIKIAEAILIPIYGEKVISEERPFNARLKGDVWIVSGSGPKELVLKGEAYVKISKQNGTVLLVAHSQ